MGKKLIGIAVVAIMLFGIFGLTSCNDFNLADYQADGRTAIQSYADAKVASRRKKGGFYG